MNTILIVLGLLALFRIAIVMGDISHDIKEHLSVSNAQRVILIDELQQLNEYSHLAAHTLSEPEDIEASIITGG